MSKNSNLQKIIIELRKSNNEFEQDKKILEDLIARLNWQLNRYMKKFGHFQTRNSDVKENVELNGNPRQDLIKLRALMQAYDEVIEEQEIALKTVQKRLCNSMESVMELTKENEDIRVCLNHWEKEPALSGDLQQVSFDVQLLLEERELLVCENKILKEKLNNVEKSLEHNVHEDRRTRKEMEKEISFLSESLHASVEQINLYQDETKVLKQQLESSIPSSEHHNSVEKCSRLLSKLKQNYSFETENLQTHVKRIKEERTSLRHDLNESSNKIQGLSTQVFGYRTYATKSRSRLIHQQRTIKALKVSRRSSEAKLKEVVALCRALLNDRQQLLNSYHSLKLEASKSENEATVKSHALGELSIKFKEGKLRWIQKVSEIEGERSSIEVAWKRASEENIRLRKLIRQKDETIEKMIKELRFPGS